jgi:CRP-like cAMP-binding protein
VACLEDSILTVANTDMEQMIFEKFPRFQILCRLLSEELLVKNQATFDSFKTSSPEQRYVNLLESRPDLLQRVPLRQLASYLGMKPESLSRIRKRLAKQSKS